MRRVDAERGAELRAEVREQVAVSRGAASCLARPSARALRGPGFDHWRRTNVAPAAAGTDIAAVVVQLPLGDITSDQMRALASARRGRTATGRCVPPTIRTWSLPWVPEGGAAGGARRRWSRSGSGTPTPEPLTDVVSCPGMDYCSLAITRSMGVAERIRAHLLDDPATGDGFAARLGRFGDQDERLPELLRPAPRRRHRPHRPLGHGRATGSRSALLLDPGRWLGRRGDGDVSGHRLGSLPRGEPRRRPSRRGAASTRSGASRERPFRPSSTALA